VHEMYRTIRLHFPELFNWMRKVDDCRKKASNYELAAHLTACLAMFLFKSGSRKQYNQHREDSQFQKNYKRLFGFAMPHGDLSPEGHGLVGGVPNRTAEAKDGSASGAAQDLP
jgi:hypothetical protein